MKKLISFIAITLFAATAFAQQQPENKYPYGPVAYRTLRQTIGEKYLVLPSVSYDYIYLKNADEPEKSLTSKDMAGKTLILVSIDDLGENGYFVDSNNVKYSNKIEKGMFFYEMIPVADIDSARRLFLNKTLWLNKKGIRLGDPRKTKKFEYLDSLRFQPVEIIEVDAGLSAVPILFIVKTTNKKIGYVYVNISGTNSDLDKKFLFATSFFSQDPKTLYHFTPQTWENIKAEKVVVGMPQDAVLLIWGPPDASHRTVTGNTTNTQWVYGTGRATRYYYFTNGRVTSID